jgi:uncharacterized membrane protein YheB (UPF0754 family)
MNKSLATNLVCALLIIIGHLLVPEPFRKHVLTMGYFGLSGAITNWIAVHMLFERVPGLYGSGIIPLKFEAFKSAIREMVMEQFFTTENIQRFLSDGSGFKPDVHPIIESLNYDLLFDGFVEVVKSSKFGGMLGMFGGDAALEPMRPRFRATLKTKLIQMAESPDFFQKLSTTASSDLHDHWQDKIKDMVEGRLAELTPAMVKEIVQEMIRSHLGWLVVWGGVFGTLIGLVSSLLVL